MIHSYIKPIKKRHDAGVHRGVGDTKTDPNGRQAHYKKVGYDLHDEQASNKTSSALLSLGYRTKTVYNRKQGESRRILDFRF
jgi:hypothetical protein